jgi:hypothetical protein
LITKKKAKIAILVIFLILVGFTSERFIFIGIDTSYDPYSEYASSNKEERGSLLGFEFIKTINSSEIDGLFPEGAAIEGDIQSLPEYDIDLYRINYTSILFYDIVTLSGLIVVPQKVGSLSHIQYHHGTLLPYPYQHGEGSLDAPSLYNGTFPETEDAQYESRLFGNFLGSYGYLVSMPDYIGFGVSDSYEHTYSVNDRLAEQSVDMILATREFCTNLTIELDGKLFLSGWSEGGAASLATQKLIEAEYQDNITVTANAPLAGFFNILYYSKLFVSFMPFLFGDWGEDLDVLIWTLYCINKFSDDQPLDSDEIFKIDVENQLDVLSNRTTGRPAKVVRYFIKDKSRLISKFAQNDLSDGWKPIAPIYIHHGTEDDIVYYFQNPEPTVKNLNKLGGNVTLVKYEGHDHYSLAKLYLLNMIAEFEQY